jgi:hypothetical protein
MSKSLYLIYYHLSLDITTTPTLNHDTKEEAISCLSELKTKNTDHLVPSGAKGRRTRDRGLRHADHLARPCRPRGPATLLAHAALPRWKPWRLTRSQERKPWRPVCRWSADAKTKIQSSVESLACTSRDPHGVIDLFYITCWPIPFPGGTLISIVLEDQTLHGNWTAF